MPPSRPVPPPSGFDSDASAVFRLAQRQLRSQGSWSDVDAPALALYVLALTNARALRLAAEECPIVEGKDGLPRVHPALGAAAECEGARSR